MQLIEIKSLREWLGKPMLDALLDSVFGPTPIRKEEYMRYRVQDPVQLTDGRVSTVIRKETPAKVEAIEAIYCKVDIGGLISGDTDRAYLLDMLITDMSTLTSQQIADEIYKTYGIYLEPGHYVLSQISSGYPYPAYPDFNRFELRILDSHLVLKGTCVVMIAPLQRLGDLTLPTRVSLIDHYGKYAADPRIPVEILLPRTYIEVESEIHQLSDITEVDTHTGPAICRALNAVLDHKWVYKMDTVDFNLYDAKILYNGYTVGGYCTAEHNFGRVMMLQLSEHCKNLVGTLEIVYRE